jgi:hypothetical protein
MTKLMERLEENALEYLIAPLISVDEYESKIDDRKVIVTGFFVKDYDPAIDLSSFIEKSSIRPLDTEVSPAPNDDGWYLVFVEMTRDEDFPERLCELIKQVDNLTNIDNWQFKPYSKQEDDFYDLSEDSVRKLINLDPIELKDEEPQEPEEPLAERVGSFLQNSLLENIEVRKDWIRINSNGQKRVYKIASFGQGSGSIPVFGLEIGSETLRESRLLEAMLGPNYSVECADGHVCINHDHNHLILTAY